MAESEAEETTKSFQCPFCLQNYECNEELKRHITFAHFSEKVECQHCELKFFTEDTFQNHQLEKHSKAKQENPQFNCQICNKELFSEINLIVHKKYVHKDEKLADNSESKKAFEGNENKMVDVENIPPSVIKSDDLPMSEKSSGTKSLSIWLSKMNTTILNNNSEKRNSLPQRIIKQNECMYCHKITSKGLAVNELCNSCNVMLNPTLIIIKVKNSIIMPKKHKNKSKNDKPQKFNCKKCEKSYYDKKSLGRHYDKAHKEEDVTGTLPPNIYHTPHKQA